MPGPRRVRVSRLAEKTLVALGETSRERLKEAIRALSIDSLLGKKLKGEFESLRSYRLGSFRIVYRYTKEHLDVVHIDHRKDVYR